MNAEDETGLDDDRAEVARQVGEMIAATGLTMTELAERLGTSRTRLSTYRSGRVVPSAIVMLRLRRIADESRGDRQTDGRRRPEPT